MEFLSKMTLDQAAWLLVILYIAHYAEEGSRLVEWFNTHFRMKGLVYTQKRLNLENILMFTHTVVSVALLNLYPENWLLQGVILGGGCGFFFLTFFHGVPTWRSGIYSPGTVTACLFHPPLFFLFVWKAYQAHLFTLPIIAAALLSGAGAFAGYILLVHKVLLKTDTERHGWLEWFPIRAKPLPWKVVYYHQEDQGIAPQPPSGAERGR